jgi:hypothetical protein
MQILNRTTPNILPVRNLDFGHGGWNNGWNEKQAIKKGLRFSS